MNKAVYNILFFKLKNYYSVKMNAFMFRKIHSPAAQHVKRVA